jgi:hypothetical protein
MKRPRRRWFVKVRNQYGFGAHYHVTSEAAYRCWRHLRKFGIVAWTNGQPRPRHKRKDLRSMRAA